MNKKALLTVHFSLTALAEIIIAASLVFFLTRWDTIPERAGIHFAANGDFDVYAEKFYGFYPHIIGTLFVAGAVFAGILVTRKKTGLSVSEKGERLFKTELCITIDLILLLIAVWCSLWTYSVSTQTPLNAALMGAIAIAMFGVGAAGVAAETVTVLKCKTDSGNADSRGKRAALDHRLHRLVSWLLTAAELLVTVLIWERLPDEDPTGFYHLNGLAYFADLGTYLSKWLLLLPFAVTVVMITVMELIGHSAKKADKTALVVFTDRLKLIHAVCGFIVTIHVLSEMTVGLPVILIYTAALAASTAAYAIKLRKTQSQDLSPQKAGKHK